MLRLQRLGTTKRPTYRLIVSEKRKDTQAGALEILGTYEPLLKDKKINLKIERIKYWLSVGAQTSNTVNNLLINNKIIEGKKRKSVVISKERKEKLAKKKGATAPVQTETKPTA